MVCFLEIVYIYFQPGIICSRNDGFAIDVIDSHAQCGQQLLYVGRIFNTHVSCRVSARSLQTHDVALLGQLLLAHLLHLGQFDVAGTVVHLLALRLGGEGSEVGGIGGQPVVGQLRLGEGQRVDLQFYKFGAAAAARALQCECCAVGIVDGQSEARAVAELEFFAVARPVVYHEQVRILDALAQRAFHAAGDELLLLERVGDGIGRVCTMGELLAKQALADVAKQAVGLHHIVVGDGECKGAAER